MATAPAMKNYPTTSSDTSARRPSGAAKPALAAVKPADDQLVGDAAEGGKSAILRLRDLVNRVSENHGHKKKDVKEIIEATFAEMAKALDGKENMMLPSLGKVRIVKQGDVATGVPMTLKLRRSIPATSSGAKDGLAEDGEDS